MNIWWCAIHKMYTSYSELKHRRVVAQGWQALGDLSNVARFVPGHRDVFTRIIQLTGDVCYPRSIHPFWSSKDRDSRRAPSVLWNLLSLQQNDLVVGIEGTTVRGICELPSNATDMYRYQEQWEYAQTLFDVEWIDWDMTKFGTPPTAPRQGVHGIKRLGDASVSVAAAWAKR